MKKVVFLLLTAILINACNFSNNKLKLKCESNRDIKIVWSSKESDGTKHSATIFESGKSSIHKMKSIAGVTVFEIYEGDKIIGAYSISHGNYGRDYVFKFDLCDSVTLSSIPKRRFDWVK